MNEQTERRKDYIDLMEIRSELYDTKIELATMNANLKNIINMFETHLADDKNTLKRVNCHDASINRAYGGLAVLACLIGYVIKGLK